jgi:hypothetical protein
VSRREITLRVERCPYCGRAHSYVIEVTLRPNREASATFARAQVPVACEMDGRAFRTQVDVPVSAGQQFVAAQFARLAVAG